MKRNIKSMKSVPANLQEFVIKELEAQLEKYFAKPDPKLLESMAILLERPLEELMANAKEDNDDYNKHAVSRLVDKAVGVFMLAGQKSTHNGDIIKVAKDQEFLLEPFKVRNLELTRSEHLINSNRYSDFAYDITIWNEIRGKFILQTEKSDDFNSMMKILDIEMPNFITQPSWLKVKSAIKKAEKRIFKEALNFPDPVEGFDEGAAKEISEADYKKMGISRHDIFQTDLDGQVVKKEFSEIKIDYRNDNHDLIAMKELVLILERKKEMGYFSIAPGFFSKYMPELKSEGIDGIIFKTTNEELVEIKLWTSAGHNNQAEDTASPYSPVSAATALLHMYAADYDKVDLNDDGTDYVLDLNDVNPNFLKNEDRYYVLVDGCVAAPEWGTDSAPFSYESYALNKIQVKAGEVFLFESRSGRPMTTRLYFTPYKPSLLHPLHQLGSVVFGSNDQTYHSTASRDLFEATNIELLDLSDCFAETDGTTQDEKYSPCVTAFQVFFCRDDKMGTNLLKAILPENRKNVMGIFYSLYEITPCSISYECKQLHKIADLYCHDKMISAIKNLLDNYAPFTKRFLYREYVKFNQATEAVQSTFFNDLAEKMRTADTMSLIQDKVVEAEINKLGQDKSLDLDQYKAKVKELMEKSKAEHLKNLGIKK